VANERRVYRRVQAGVLARPTSFLARAAAKRVNDISLGGLRVHSDEAWKPGARLELELLFPDGASAVFLAEVVWVEALVEGAPARFDVGFKFVAVNAADLEHIAAVLGEGVSR
jgi:hypothetical protein